MGNKLGKRKQVVDEKYTRPQGLYQHKDVNLKKLRKLILQGHLAPCYLGDDECGSDLEECPICFLYFPSLNRSGCCKKGICTECYLQVLAPYTTQSIECPFCKTLNYGVVYRGVKTKEEKDLEQIEEQRVIEAIIRMRQQELQDDENRILERTEISSSNSMVTPTGLDYSSTRGLSFSLAVESEGNSQVQSAASTIRLWHRQRQNRPKIEGGADIQDVLVNENPRNKVVEVDVVGETRISQDDGIRIQENISVSENKEKLVYSQVSDSGVNMTRDFPATSNVSYVVEEAGQFNENGAVKEKMESSLKHGTGQVVVSSTLAVAQQSPESSKKGQKQKGNDFQGSSSSSASPSVVKLIDFSNDIFSSRTPHGAVEKISSLHETLNQLITMKLESQKQMETLVTATVAKEGKRIEAALEKSMENAIKDSCDAPWVRFQEETVNTETASKEQEQTQQVISVIKNCLRMDLTGIIEKTINRELTAAMETVAQTITPLIEETISSSFAECFQDGVRDKLVNQLEKSVNSKLEATIAKKIQAEFQTPGYQVLQDTLKSSFEDSMIPAFEMLCRAMFEQVDATFQKGMVEHTAAALQELEASLSPLALALADAKNSASSMTQALGAKVLDGQRELFALAANSISANPCNQLRSGPSVGLHQDIGLPFDPTKELSRLISECKYEEAFTTALQNSDIIIVSWLCSQVDLPRILTQNPLPLSQAVLLSLLQQLACDISNETSRKLTWMTEVLSVLYPTDPVIAVHVRPIFEQVYKILNHHMNIPSISGYECSNIRLIMHVINSMLMISK